MTLVATKIVNCDAIRVPCVAIRIRHVVKTASICPAVLNVAKHSMLHANRKLDVLVDMLTVQNRHRWPMGRFVRNAASVEMANACRIVRRRDCKAVCVISFRMRANGAVE